jgi:hypothetical protein
MLSQLNKEDTSEADLLLEKLSKIWLITRKLKILG